MDINQEHGLNYKQIDNVDEFIDNAPTIRNLVKMYVDTVGDKFTVDDIMNMMNLAVGQKSIFIGLFTRLGMGVGLMTAHAVNHNDMKLGAMVHIGVVDRTMQAVHARWCIDTAMQSLFKWAENLGMTSIFTQTSRSEKPFDKLLDRYGWKRITTVYEKEITNGKPENSATDTSRPAPSGIPGAIV